MTDPVRSAPISGPISDPAYAPASDLPQADPKARAAAQAFEAVFIGQMTKLMMESAEPQGDFSGGHGAAMFRGVLAEQLGAAITRGGGLGITDSVLAEIVRLQQTGGNTP
ncbi:MAG: rod-binding protein [Sphingobium sp.]|nr:rod-binding protein [Sphingobium sp.]MBP6111595.1 rod-binding protein [Sphingobium sp.]MBP8670956.1 rod-binding protein [Sphingobium sp.]MBP9158077.1 rod-binding protein [Sphingobium sp.]MCC6482005.1 rod-binding protein [Sphingomonadaceae bacterium]